MPRYEILYGEYESDDGTVYRARDNDVVELDESTADFLGDQVGRVESPDTADGDSGDSGDSAPVGEPASDAATGNAEYEADDADGREPVSEAERGPIDVADIESVDDNPEPEPADLAVSDTPEADLEAAHAGMDDFTVLEGIGPSYNDRLHETGYLTFADLSAAEPDDLAEIDGISDEIAHQVIEAVRDGDVDWSPENANVEETGG